MQDDVKIKLKQSNIKMKVGTNTPTQSETDHSKLTNLDFENSGHTGFQPAGDYANKSDLNLKVDKVEGKGLTTNDFTNEYKEKVDLIETNGDGNSYLANDGTYKEIESGVSIQNVYTIALEGTSTNKDTFLAFINEYLTTKNQPILLLNPNYSDNPVMMSHVDLERFKSDPTYINNMYMLMSDGSKTRIYFVRLMVGGVVFNEDKTQVISVSYANAYLGDSIVKYSGVGTNNGYLATNNTTEFTPRKDYNPATKKYVDDLINQLKVDNGLS